MFDFLSRFSSTSQARAALPELWGGGSWKSELVLETVWFENSKPSSDYCLLIQKSEGDERLRSMAECIIELDREAAIRGDVFIRLSRLSNAELRRGYFSPTFPGSRYPRPLLMPPRELGKIRIWRPYAGTARSDLE
jgi:hypothetical protein